MSIKSGNEPCSGPAVVEPPDWVGVAFNLLAIGAVLCVGIIAVSALLATPPPASAGITPVDPPVDLCRSNDDGYLTGKLFGSLEGTIDWRGRALECNGMPRPGGDGIRLVFAGADESSSIKLVIVLGIDGHMNELRSGERAANVTIIDESGGRFYSTSGADRCWTTINSVEALNTLGGESLQVGGEVYCLGSVPSLSDSGSVTLRDFRYSGRLSLDAS